MQRIHRLKEWKLIQKVLPDAEEEEVLAGDAAEQFLMEIVEGQLSFKGCHLFASKRIPSKQLRRRFEVDLIVLTPKHMHIFEVKNWSGELVSNRDKWIQIRRSGEEIEHANLVEYNSDKANLLIDYLFDRRIEIPADFVRQKVIFMNPRLRIDSYIEDNPDVLTRHKLDTYLGSQKRFGSKERLAHTLIKWCLDTESAELVINGYFSSILIEKHDEISKKLGQLGTWDKIKLYGGKCLRGDILRINIGAGQYPIEDLRRGVWSQVAWNRSKLLGLLQAIFRDSTLGTLRSEGKCIPVTTSDSILFHCAGQPAPVLVEMVAVDAIFRG